MKLFGHEFGRVAEKLKGFWAKGGGPSRKSRKFYPGQFPWAQRCMHFDKLLESNANAKSAVWSAAGRVLENGIFLVASDKYDRAVEACDRCEEFNKRVGMETLIYNTVVMMLTHGSCFWEKTTDPIFDVKLIPNQELIAPVKADSNGEITQWTMMLPGVQGPVWNQDEIVHFHWIRTSQTYPYGMSLFTGCENEISILERLEVNIAAHMERTAFPQTAIGVGNDKSRPTPDEVADIRASIKNWKPGEIHATSYELTKADISGDRPIQNLAEVLEFCKDNVTDAFLIAPISKLYNSTEASSKEMQKSENARLIAPVQVKFGRILEKEVYKPMLEWLQFSRRVCPTVQWVDPDAEREEQADYWQKWIEAGVPLEYAIEKAGFDVEKVMEMKKKEDQRMLEQQNELSQFQKTQPFGNQPQQEQKSEEYWEVRRKKK